MTPAWMSALETQLTAISMIERVIGKLSDKHMSPWERQRYDLHWHLDREMLRTATPFAWSKETIDAVHAAAHSIPLDAQLATWNLAERTAWWWFAEPIPLQTTLGTAPLRALNLGWRNNGQFAVTCWTDRDGADGLTLFPSQVWQWKAGETLEQMLGRVLTEHHEVYGPGGRFAGMPQTTIDVFMAAAEWISRFILAGSVWIDQRVLLAPEAPVERHRRKAFNRATGQTMAGVKVVELRRAESRKSDAGGGTTEWSQRWVVDGHFRNQPCGARSADRKLIFIHPFIKGPEDKPLVVKTKVYAVDR